MGKHVFTIVVAVVIGVSLLMYLFSYQVRTNEVALVQTFGEAAEEASPAGWHFQWPWPIQEVRRFDNRLQVQEGPLAETPMNEQYSILTSVCVGWKIGNVREFNKSFGGSKDPMGQCWAELEKTVRDRTNGVLGQYNLSDLVNVDPKQIKYDEVESKIRDAAAEAAMDLYGVELVLFKIRRLELPDSVRNQVYLRMRTERQAEAEEIRRKGETEADSITAAANSERDAILARAEREVERIRGEGDAEAAKFYDEFKKDPNLAVLLRKARALKKTTEEATTIFLDTTVPPYDLLAGDVDKVEK